MEDPQTPLGTGGRSLRTAAPHPLRSRARILLTSVFGPYARDDEYGSRAINPMELYHNQITRVQGPFSLRMFHRSWGLMLIQANVAAPCALLDFPTLDRFIEEVRERAYDIVGISSITTNLLKVRRMCELVRQVRPTAAIVVGGHIAQIPDLHRRIDADWIVRGEGVRWFREYLGEDPQQPVRHPVIPTRIGTRNMGVSVKDEASGIAVTIIPSVGCPVGCNFCATSSMFGGKGRHVSFYGTGDELFDLMCQIEELRGTRSFFFMDENFLLDRRRALRLLELVEAHDKAWILYVFSSAAAVRSYALEELVALGVSWIWLGLEGEDSPYSKLHGIDTMQLVRDLQSHGIRVLGSSIIGLEHHTPENMDEVIGHAVRHDADFHQFMLYMPLPGTPLHAQLAAQGRLLEEDECPTPDTHGQFRFNYRHPHIPAGLESELIVRAFQRDFETNGPSMLRVVRTTLTGWKRYRNHPNQRIRRRFAHEIEGMVPAFSAVAGAAARYYRGQPRLYAKMTALLDDIRAEFGLKSWVSAALGSAYLLRKIRREERRLARGWSYEPPTFYEVNAAAAAADFPGASVCASVSPRVPSRPVPEDALPETWESSFETRDAVSRGPVGPFEDAGDRAPVEAELAARSARP
jgi:hypothetical protein